MTIGEEMKNQISVTRTPLIVVLVCVSVFLCRADASLSKTMQQTPDKAATSAAKPSDVATMDSIVSALYDVISGPAGKKRDWDRFRSLFIPGARLVPTGKRQTGEVGSRVLTPEDYVERSSKSLEENGFFEKEVPRHTES